MTNVKVGDKIKITGSTLPTFWYCGKIGEVYTVAGFSNLYSDGTVDILEIPHHCVRPQDFEVVKENNGFVVNEQGGMPIVNEKGGVKNFGGKPQPSLLFKSMPQAVLQVIEVLTYGANKYSADNWKLVDEIAYHDAFQRHYLSYCVGEIFDPESKKHHISHMICSLLFILQKDLEKNIE